MKPRSASLVLTIAYDGTRFAGWQKQSAPAELRRPSIQGEVERAAARILRQPVTVIGSGRTDAGVHARGQVAHVCCATDMPLSRLHRALNAVLPPDIRVIRLKRAADGFHARYCCRSKSYRYVIYNHSVAPVFDRWFVWHVAEPLRADLMARAAGMLIGRHDFTSFQAQDAVRRPAVRTLRRLSVRRKGRYLIIDVEADGFVYTMVRSMVGTLVEIGRGKIAPQAMRRILRARDRAAAGPTAPARGLTLLAARYD